VTRVLLDTHTFIWYIEGHPSLSVAARQAIENPLAEKWVSVASAWEMHIKAGLGRLPVEDPLDEFIPHQLELNGFRLLAIDLQHLHPISKLPPHHNDPFDRLLIAQALVENIPIISRDKNFDAYEGLTRIW